MILSTLVNSDPGVLAYNAFQLIGIAGIYSGESQNPMPYSKFASNKNDKKDSAMVPSQVGMLIIYVPATIVAFVYQMVSAKFFQTATPTFAGWMVLLHFLKRDLEVLLLHKYSGETQLNAARMIGFMYALTAFMISLVANPEASALSLYLGLALFIIGSFGNFYHHYLLAQLRSSSSNKNSPSKKYVAPRGGLFRYVAAPHYMFEIIAWMGISIASEQLTGYLNLLSMTLYLSARSKNQNEWNKNKFDEKEWPASRKNMVPFVY